MYSINIDIISQCVLRKEERNIFYYYYKRLLGTVTPSTKSQKVAEWEKYEHRFIRLCGTPPTLSRHRVVLLPRGKLIDSS